MPDQVSLAVRPVIDFLLGFRYRLETGGDIDLYTLRNDLHNALQAVEAVLRDSPTLHSRADLIRYLLVGFADEVILLHLESGQRVAGKAAGNGVFPHQCCRRTFF